MMPDSCPRCTAPPSRFRVTAPEVTVPGCLECRDCGWSKYLFVKDEDGEDGAGDGATPLVSFDPGPDPYWSTVPSPDDLDAWIRIFQAAVYAAPLGSEVRAKFIDQVNLLTLRRGGDASAEPFRRPMDARSAGSGVDGPGSVA